MNEKKIGFIGVGNMANAIIGGILKNRIPANQIALYNRHPEKCAALEKKGMTVCSSAEELTRLCDIIFLTIKPQNFPEVLEQIRSSASQDKIFVSVAAGISTKYIREELQGTYMVIRAMPNTPLSIAKGATALYCPPGVPEEALRLVKSFFEACGMVRMISEEEMNPIISISGSSPAYFYLFVKAMTDYARQQGLNPQMALELICQTMIGSAGMLLETGKTAEELIRMVSSPGGTTLEALKVFQESDVEGIICNAMKACAHRAEELEK